MNSGTWMNYLDAKHLVMNGSSLLSFRQPQKDPGAHLTRTLATFLVAALPFAAFAADKPAAKPRMVKADAVPSTGVEPRIASSAALVVDAKTGQTLYSKNAEEAVPIAS